MLLIVLLAVMTCLPLLHSGYTTTDDAYLNLGVQAGNRMSGLGDSVLSGRLQHAITGRLQPLAYGWGHYWVMKSLSIRARTVFAISPSPPYRPSGVASSTERYSYGLVPGGATMGPGAMAFTRMLSGASSSASASVRAFTPDFAT